MKKFTKSDIVRLVGLLAFIVITALIVLALRPYIADVFTEGGVGRLVERLQSAGVLGVLALLGLQVLQVVVAFIPGEVVQMAAGLMYGPWIGSLILIVGLVLASWLVFALVHKLGAPFVRDMVSTEHMEKFHEFERTGKLSAIVFILFLIPGLPKDVFTYLVPLTDMRMKTFLILSNTARIPGILASTFVASGLGSGHYVSSIVVAAIMVVIVALVVVFRNQLMNFLARTAVDDAEMQETEAVKHEREEAAAAAVANGEEPVHHHKHLRKTGEAEEAAEAEKTTEAEKTATTEAGKGPVAPSAHEAADER